MLMLIWMNNTHKNVYAFARVDYDSIAAALKQVYINRHFLTLILAYYNWLKIEIFLYGLTAFHVPCAEVSNKYRKIYP